ncbi:hypothetical protein B0H14DRAFT_3497171 [Mycena olivaceomarginata]|nr:hypothetical protein B0H14DRAFT_3497171 [Mycena olivaceomarginata]
MSATHVSICKLVLDVYDTQWEWFEDIDVDDAEILGETYEYSTDDLQPERRAAFWDYLWEFPMHRRCLPEHLEAVFTAALTSVTVFHCIQTLRGPWSARGVAAEHDRSKGGHSPPQSADMFPPISNSTAGIQIVEILTRDRSESNTPSPPPQ